jgi:hypothetical protein
VGIAGEVIVSIRRRVVKGGAAPPLFDRVIDRLAVAGEGGD